MRRTTLHLLMALALLIGVGCSDSGDDGASGERADAGAQLDTSEGVADSGEADTAQADSGAVSDSGDAPEDTEPSPDTAAPQDTAESPDTAEPQDTAEPTDTVAATDTEPPEDGGEDTAAPEDAAPDAGAEVPLMGFGALSGECGVLDEELAADGPVFVRNTIDFGDMPYTDAELELLTEGGQEIIADGNAGGSSLLSEVFAYEVLQRCELAALLKTETEIVYVDPNGKLTDLLVEIDELKIGVSVTRAVGFPRDDPYTVERARELLTDKLEDVAASSANVAAEDAWVKQILHVIAYAPQHADSMAQAYTELSPEVLSDTIVIVTVSEGQDDFLY